MIRVFFRDMSAYKVEKPNGVLEPVKACAEHCKQYDSIYLDDSLNREEQRLSLIHEVLDMYLPRVKHSRFDTLSIKIIEALQAGKFLK